MTDNVNRPTHYNTHPSGIECIQVTEHMGFNLGNAIKYVFRAGKKDSALQDLRKGLWYVNRERERQLAERWAKYPNDDRYEVSTLGRVRNRATGHCRMPVKLKNGYLTILISRPAAKSELRYIHRMVWETFSGRPIGENEVVRHVDGDRKNCRLTNLAHGTQSENMADRRRHGTHYFGERNPAAKLTADQVEAIQADTRTESAVGVDYGVSRSTIGRIRRGESWRDGRTSGEKAWSRFLDFEPNENVRGAIYHLGLTLWRPDPAGNSEDNLNKAIWYLNREVKRIEGQNA